MGRFYFTSCALLILVAVVAAIDFEKPCKDGETWKDDCHTCSCAHGKPSCSRELCPSEAGNTVILPTPAPAGKSSCTPGEKWVEDCNNCICDNQGVPECSRRLCP
ncbi:Pacifastin inhibitor (LCMII) [Nesidiocoris tenuis]|uniref:Pacifastin inhibitor (LCMII) n=1 Tax=Nesidiocoris tenuis TaxID=355587 RepID=A0ABN7BDE2_9HEMI|nr:Pacifastin inhibitor (LCMII) [Nesidiocoris tenuis]